MSEDNGAEILREVSAARREVAEVFEAIKRLDKRDEEIVLLNMEGLNGLRDSLNGIEARAQKRLDALERHAITAAARLTKLEAKGPGLKRRRAA